MENKIFKGVVEYNPNTGKFVWIKPTSNRVSVGSPVGDEKVRYMGVCIHNVKYLLHRLALELMTGKQIPTGFVVDHINQDTHDNRIANLRIIREKDNARNKPKRRDNVSGATGVSFDKWGNTWRASITDPNGKVIKLGRFKNFEDAVRVRKDKEKEFNYHKNHGINLSKNEYRSK
ncbi:hypothetical protein BV741P1_00030 [Phocaeicola phage BV741P1]|nr:hypothetical protein BV741P1_00030 [Phocaeicola phage BV741P1]